MDSSEKKIWCACALFFLLAVSGCASWWGASKERKAIVIFQDPS